MANKRNYYLKSNRVSLHLFRALLFGSTALWQLGASPSSCCGSPALPSESTQPLSLTQCVERLLTHNLDLTVERYNPYLEEKEITKEKATFDPLARFSLQDRKLIISPTTFLNGVWDPDHSYEEETIDYEASISKKLMTGGVGELKFTTNRFETNSFFQYVSPTYHTRLIVSLNQPLLRNFGVTLNQSRILISRNNKDISLTRLKEKLITTIFTLEQAYWNLYLHQQLLDVRKSSLKLAQNLLERNTALVEVGKLPSVEVLRARNGVVSREEAVIIAEKSVGNAEDLLKEMLNLPLSSHSISLADSPTLKELPSTEVGPHLKVALANRPDYEEAQLQLKKCEIAHRMAKNAMLPLFDFQASYGLNATKKHHAQSIEGLHAGGDYSWMVGFKMEIPLGNRYAKSEYEKSRLELSKGKTLIESLEKKIEVEIREVLREIESSHKRISATRQARLLAEKNLEAEEERMSLGMSTSVDVLHYQDELTAAQCAETNALIDYINALNSLQKVTGTTISSYQISIEE